MRARPAAVLVVGALVVLAGCVSAPSGNPDGADTADVPEGSLAVHFIAVGQGDAVLLEAPSGETMLIDSGHYDDDGEHVLAYLRRHGVDRIDYLVTSHAHADHVGGHAAVIDYYETEADGIGAIYDPGYPTTTRTYDEYLDAVEEHGVTLYETRAGDEIPMDGVDVEVLGPPAEPLAGGDVDENSLLLRVAFGETTFLFTGDGGSAAERYLRTTHGDRVDATVLKAGHHGSNTSTGGAFLDAVDPRAVVVSSAYESPYGHPHEPVLRRLADHGVRTYWTATHGDTVLVSDGTSVVVRTQADAPSDPLSLRDGDPVDPGSTAPTERRTAIGPAGEQPTPATATDGGIDTVTQRPADSGGALAVAEINADAAGDDNDNLNDEYVVFENVGDDPLDLSGWTVEDEAGHTYAFPEGVVLDPGEQVTVHTGSGADGDGHRYWGAGRAIWNNDGDTVIVRSADGTVVLREGY